MDKKELTKHFNTKFVIAKSTFFISSSVCSAYFNTKFVIAKLKAIC